MLKTSPVLTSSANASPTAFRRGHAAPRSSQPASRQSTSISTTHRPSSLTSSSPKAAPGSPRHLRAQPCNPAADDPDPVRHDNVTSRQKINHLPPSPLSQPNITPSPSDSLASDTAAQSQPAQPAQSVQPAQPATTTSDNDAHKVLSPNKRRVSPDHPSENSTARAGERNDSRASPPEATTTAPKRAKTDGAPKVLPQRYELCAVDDIVELIAHMLAELIATNDAIRISSGGLTRFHSRTAPGISVRDYLHRLARHATLTPPLLLSMVYYIDRLCALYPEFTINTLTVHRFLITAATVAAKGLSDSFWNNTTYARVGGVRVAELKMLELEFLYRVDWKIVPNPEVLVAYYRGLVERTPQYTLESDGSSDDSSLDDDDDDDDNVNEDEEKLAPTKTPESEED